MGLIPPFFFDCVVAIGVDDSEGKRQWIASGFLYGHHIPTEGEARTYRVFLVTNRHVFESLQQVYLRFNPEKVEEPARDYPLPLLDAQNKPLWYSHSNKEIDVAVISINFQLLKEQAMQAKYFQSDQHVADIQKLNDLGIIEGDFAYALGFPLGLVGSKRNTVIARSGTIARIRDTLTKENPEYLIDAFVFPGNSGGPVVSKPEITAIKGTKSQNASYLIGIVKSYVPYQDVAVSLQTKQPRVIFEENSGLAAVHPIDYVQEIVRTSIEMEPKKVEEEKTAASEKSLP